MTETSKQSNITKIKNINSTLEAMLSHRSVRSFTDEPISAEMLEAVLEAGRAVSTSNYMQSVSVI
ncbi:nitroreductase family protein, partial [Leptospira borgpetersenii serovar Balcanica]|nr:nitroreductase family protein [Leptospira borgpetersenii serovar Balcanica]